MRQLISSEIVSTWRCRDSDDFKQCDALQCDTLKCDALKCDTLKCDALQCDTLKCDALKCDAVSRRERGSQGLRRRPLGVRVWGHPSDAFHRVVVVHHPDAHHHHRRRLVRHSLQRQQRHGKLFGVRQKSPEAEPETGPQISIPFERSQKILETKKLKETRKRMQADV